MNHYFIPNPAVEFFNTIAPNAPFEIAPLSRRVGSKPGELRQCDGTSLPIYVDVDAPYYEEHVGYAQVPSEKTIPHVQLRQRHSSAGNLW